MTPCSLPTCLKVGISPVLATFGPISIYWYGLLIAIGFVIAIRLAMGEAERRGIDPDQFLSAVLVASLLGLFGARLYYVLTTQPGYYLSLDHLGEALSLWQGGLSFYGGIVGAAVGGWLYAARYRMPILRVLDIGALVAGLGQSIGLIGSVINGDVSGYVTRGWGVEYTLTRNLLIPPGSIGVTFQPVALYGAVYSLIIFAVLWFVVRPRRLPAGRITGIYLAAWAAGQLVIFSFRAVPLGPAGLKVGQLAALPLLAAGLWLVLRPAAPEAESAAAPAAPPPPVAGDQGAATAAP